MSKNIYRIINCFVLFWAGIFLLLNYKDSAIQFAQESSIHIILFFAIALLVHLLKAFRFYFILMDSTMLNRQQFIKQYCKTAFVNILIPLKAGELFRIYCYGWQNVNLFTSIVYVILDRFFDTAALLAVLFILVTVTNQKLPIILVCLVAAITLLIVIYILLPSLCRYWKNYFLMVKATQGRLKYLQMINGIEITCEKVKTVIKGKGLIVATLSVGAWLAELVGVFLWKKLCGMQIATSFFQNYLMAAMGIEQSDDLNMIIVAMVVILLTSYFLLYLYCIYKEHRK